MDINGNGDIYEGEFKNDDYEGKGIIYYNDGSRKMGDYINGNAIGKHVKMDENGEPAVIDYD